MAADVAFLVSARRIANRERLFLRIAALLNSHGCRVTFLAAGPEGELTAALPSFCRLVNISSLPASLLGGTVPHGLRIASAVPRLAGYLRKAKPGVLFATSVPPNLAAALAAASAGFAGRLVLRQSNAIRVDDTAGFSSVQRNWRDRLIPRLYARADAIIANSNGVAENLIALGLDASRIVAIPNGVECDRIAEATQQRDALPAPANAPDPLIITVGRLVAQKDHATLIRAFARLSAAARLMILGEGPERPRLEMLARGLGVHDRITFPGYIANPFPALARADLFVLSSRYEGMPNALLEALACGLPIVSTDCPHGPAEILEDGLFGSLVPVGDYERLAQEMARCLNAPRNADRQRARARAFDAARIAQLYVDALLPGDPAAAVSRAAE